MLHRSVAVNSRGTAAPIRMNAAGGCKNDLSGCRKWGLLCSFGATVLLMSAILWSLRRPEVLAKADGLAAYTDGSGTNNSRKSEMFSFTEVVDAYSKWDSQAGCSRFRNQHSRSSFPRPASFQDPEGLDCGKLNRKHVSIRVEAWTWIPDSLNNLYACSCGLTCLWTKSPVLADNPDALFYEYHKPPAEDRSPGDPLRIYIELEPDRTPAPSQDIFVSYHASSDVQSTYAGALFHNVRSYYVSPSKNKDVLVYWSSSRCLPAREQIASSFLSLVPHHSFGKCLNNVDGGDAALKMYPKCRQPGKDGDWNQHLHCAMSHYKFALAIENTMTESYVTEKLFYALDAGTVPIYFGAPNVLDLVPPHSIIQGSKFSSMESLAAYVKELATDPVKYAEYHAWRRCGVMGNYYWTRKLSLDSLPCRLCAKVVAKL